MPACDASLGLQSGEIADCQLKSSPVATADHNVSRIRPGVPSFWSPAVDLDVDDHWIQFSFHRLTRIQSISFFAIRDQGVMLRAWIEISKNGIDWSPVAVVKNKNAGSEAKAGHQDSNFSRAKSTISVSATRESPMTSAPSLAVPAGKKQQEHTSQAVMFDLVYQRDGSFEQKLDGINAHFLRIHGISFSGSGSAVGLDTKSYSKTNTSKNQEEEEGRRLIGLKMELHGCYIDPLSSSRRQQQQNGTCDNADAADAMFSKLQEKKGRDKRRRRDSAMREYSVNPKSNIILLCEIRSDYRWVLRLFSFIASTTFIRQLSCKSDNFLSSPHQQTLPIFHLFFRKRILLVIPKFPACRIDLQHLLSLSLHFSFFVLFVRLRSIYNAAC